ncbi:MAG: hypothetical protein M5R36_08165 [Deltaproteobacteria bacterium]|nr:hypothetical protein [Deltaproteobacteria bacterium]
MRFSRHLPAGLFAALLIVAVLAVPAMAQDEDAAEGEEAPPKDVQADKPRVSNLPINFKGMSGLILTTSTKALAPGTVELGPAWRSEQSDDPDYTRTTWAGNAAVGIPGGLEFGLHVPYVETDLYYTERVNEFGQKVRDFRKKNQSDLGSIEGMLKWAFAQQELFLPSFAAGVGFIAPTGDYTQHISQVKSYGLRALLMMGIEINDLFFTDYAFAIMGDGGIVVQDLGVGNDREYEEKHGEVHFGMIFPLHPTNYVELITEYEGLLMRGTTNEEDENSFLGGLRLTTQHINLTFGAMFTMVEARDMDDRLTYIANFSYKLGPPFPMFP